jgi:hypothetical protein
MIGIVIKSRAASRPVTSQTPVELFSEIARIGRPALMPRMDIQELWGRLNHVVSWPSFRS